MTDGYEMKLFLLFLLLAILQLGFGQNLSIKSDNYGISHVSYRGVTLLNKETQVGLPFSTEACKVIHKGGKEEWLWTHQAYAGRTQNANEWQYIYNFGEIFFRYKAAGDSLFFDVTVKNVGTTDTLCGVNIVPLQLKFPQRPAGYQPFFYYYHYNLDAPSVIRANYGSGKMVLSNEEVSNNFFVGLLDANQQNGSLYKVWLSAVPFNGMSTNGVPNLELRLAPGKSVTYKIGLRFYPSQTPDENLGASVLAKYRTSNKLQFTWNDRRPIGALFLSSAGSNTALNPRAWLPNQPISIRGKDDLADFKRIIMQYADRSIAILKKMNAQGMITWDIEGQEFPHAISYVGSPDQLPRVAPEMNAIADEYFAKFSKAGFKTGVCIRPQQFVLSKDGKSAFQKESAVPASVLIQKIRYAKKRWGCSIFYIDSNVDPSGILLNVSVIRKVREACPDVLLVPEHQNTKYFEYSAPYEELRSAPRGMDDLVRQTYPKGFMVVYTAETLFDPQGVQKMSEQQLKNVISQGNILLFRAWYEDEPSNSMIKKVLDR